MMLESAMHAESCFATLTYNQVNHPVDGSVVPKDSQKWLKRLRQAVPKKKLRYFLVGEYGEKCQRPHYHAALFGIGPLEGGGVDGISGVVESTWGLGHTYVGELNQKSASYIGGYVTKKMTNEKNQEVKEYLNGRHPEFARMSLKPGIGASAMAVVSSAMESDAGIGSILSSRDVPSALRNHGSVMPLGRYLKSKLRTEMGYGEKLKADSLLAFTAKMCAMREADLSAAEAAEKTLIEYQLDKRNQKSLNLETKFKIHSAKGTI